MLSLDTVLLHIVVGCTLDFFIPELGGYHICWCGIAVFRGASSEQKINFEVSFCGKITRSHKFVGLILEK